MRDLRLWVESFGRCAWKIQNIPFDVMREGERERKEKGKEERGKRWDERENCECVREKDSFKQKRK